MRLEKKTAIITGAARGLGACTALTFAREGAAVVVADVLDEPGQQIVNQILQEGGRALYVHTDVTDPQAVENMVRETGRAFDRIDILVNNAGITRDAQLLKMELDQWQKVIDVNLTGVYLCGRAAARVMAEQPTGGVILNAASVVGLYGNFGQSNYVAAKAGVIGMTKTWARELGRKNIRVNAVAPGFIATEMVQTVPEKIIDALIARTPLGCMGEPQDIANAYLFLASDEAKFITGAVLSVDGGLIA